MRLSAVECLTALAITFMAGLSFAICDVIRDTGATRRAALEAGARVTIAKIEAETQTLMLQALPGRQRKAEMRKQKAEGKSKGRSWLTHDFCSLLSHFHF